MTVGPKPRFSHRRHELTEAPVLSGVEGISSVWWLLSSHQSLPPRFASIHEKYLEGLSYYDQATDEITYGIDNLDLDALKRARALMTLGNAAIIEASNEIDALVP